VRAKSDLWQLVNAAWEDYKKGKLAMLQLPQEIEAVRFAVERLRRGDRELAEAECRKFAGSWSLWRLAMEDKKGESENV
jgi:hypothetical protein